MRATVEVNDWYSLGLELRILHHELEKIQADGRDIQDHQRKMILKWLDTGCATWSILVEALKSPLINKVAVAEKITKDHPRKYEITAHLNNMQGFTYRICWLEGCTSLTVIREGLWGILEIHRCHS